MESASCWLNQCHAANSEKRYRREGALNAILFEDASQASETTIQNHSVLIHIRYSGLNRSKN